MKRLVFFFGDRDGVMKVMKNPSVVGKITSLRQPVYESCSQMYPDIPTANMIDWVKPLDEPITIRESDVRKFRSLMGGGLYPVQMYEGYKLTSVKAVVDFFMRVVEENTPNILIKMFDDTYQTLPDGLSMVIDINPSDVVAITEMLKLNVEDVMTVSVESDLDADVTLDDAGSVDKLENALEKKWQIAPKSRKNATINKKEKQNGSK